MTTKLTKKHKEILSSHIPEYTVELVSDYNKTEYTYELKASESELVFNGQLNKLRKEGFEITYIDFKNKSFHVKIVEDSE